MSKFLGWGVHHGRQTRHQKLEQDTIANSSEFSRGWAARQVGGVSGNSRRIGHDGRPGVYVARRKSGRGAGAALGIINRQA